MCYILPEAYNIQFLLTLESCLVFLDAVESVFVVLIFIIHESCLVLCQDLETTVKTHHNNQVKQDFFSSSLGKETNWCLF